MQPKKIGIFPLAMINVAAIISLKNLPITAEYGSSLVFYLVLASLIFFIPTSLISAELATTYPERGGIYIWVKKAFGDSWGFLAIWLQWVENVIWYPTILSFAAGTIAYSIDPSLASNKVYMTAIILLAFWGFTFFNFLGMQALGWISTIGVILGTIIPGLFILLLGSLYIFNGNPVEISWDFIPSFRLDNMVFLSGILLSLAGMEMSAVHAKEVKDPRKNYPKAIFLSMIIILALSILGSLMIAVVVPQKELSLVAGMMQAFEVFFHKYDLDWMTSYIAILASIGAFAMVSTWIIGPSKGLMATADNGDLPQFFQKRNQHNVPTNLLFLQGAIVTILSLIFLFMPSVSSSYWLLSAMTAQLYLIMYLLLFVSAIALRKKDQKSFRPYKAPFLHLLSYLGIFGSLFAIVMGFIPPKGFAISHTLYYFLFLSLSMAIFCVLPFIFLTLHKKYRAKQ